MIPETIGRYTIDSELGRGGMATVYKAHDPRFDRTVAIKVLPREFLHDPEFRARFEREARTIAALEHSAIVPVYDYGEQDGQLYLVMRYMPGGSMADRLQQGPISIDEAANVIRRIGSALDSAHQQGIIHRDLKPGNILLDQHGDAYLADFGIAHLSSAATALTVSGRLVGTPAYMSPEQVYGDKVLDGRSDIYAIGVILYQMLSGEAPYRADTPAKVMMQHVMDPVPNILADKPDLPVACERVIKKAMAKERDERYATASDMARELTTVSQNLHRSDLPLPETSISSPPLVTQAASGTIPTAAQLATASSTTAPEFSPTHLPQWVIFGGGAILLLIVAGLVALLLRNGNNIPGELGSETPTLQATLDSDATGTALALITLSTTPAAVTSTVTQAELSATPPDEGAATATSAQAIGATESPSEASTRRAELAATASLAADLVATRQAAEAAATSTAPTNSFAPIFGPDSNDIPHDLDDLTESVFAGVNLSDLAADVTFTNPFAGEGWDMGITFRQVDANEEFRLVVRGDGLWSLNNRQGDNDNFVHEGDVSHLLTLGENGHNRMSLMATGDWGIFLLNNTFVARLDLSARPDSGDVVISTGYYLDSEREGAATSYQNFAIWSLSPSFGPSSGELAHEPNDLVKSISSNQEQRNFVVSATFVNPFAVSTALWDYGYAFRKTDVNDQFWLVVRGDGSWVLNNRVDGEGEDLDSGTLEGFDGGADGRNELTLVVLNEQGYFFLNDTFVTQLDLSERLVSGDIEAITAYYPDSEVEGAATGYEAFTIWPLP
jgi:serine/threonine protein kinase